MTPTRTNAVEQHNYFNALPIQEISDEDSSQGSELLDATQFHLEKDKNVKEVTIAKSQEVEK